MQNFYREAKIIISIVKADFSGFIRTFEIPNLRISFNLTKSIAWATNTGYIRIYNLSSDTRNSINYYGDRVELQAGYANGSGLQTLFVGRTTAVSHQFDAPEITTTLECADGDQFVNNKKGAYSFAPGTAARTVIQSIANDMQVDIGDISSSDNLAYPRGFSDTNLSKECMIKACNLLNLQASIQNNALYVVPKNRPRDIPPIDISESNGMQGVPERFTYKSLWEYKAQDAPTAGYKVNTILNPLILPGVPATLTSSHLNIFKEPHWIQTVRHAGDTHGPLWTSNLEMTLVK